MSAHPFLDAFAARDFAAMRELLHPDVVLKSPILSVPFVGREVVLELYEVITEALEDVRYSVEMAEGNVRFFSWYARVRGTEIQGGDIMRLDAQGRITEFTVFVRPLEGVAVLSAALGRALATRRSPLRGVLAGVASAPLIALSRATDRIAPRLVK